LAIGTPVVATDVGGNREQIHSSDLGILVPDGDAESLTTAIIQAIRHNWDRPLIASVGSRRTWEHVGREVETVFERVVAMRHAADGRKTRTPIHAPSHVAEVPG
jgi:glycosyltransferase involved in cell wall biosynthesis